VLGAERVRSTFFVIGEKLVDPEAAVARMLAPVRQATSVSIKACSMARATSGLGRSSRSTSTLGFAARKAARISGRNSAAAAVLASNRTCPFSPRAYSPTSPRIRSI